MLTVLSSYIIFSIKDLETYDHKLNNLCIVSRLLIMKFPLFIGECQIAKRSNKSSSKQRKLQTEIQVLPFPSFCTRTVLSYSFSTLFYFYQYNTKVNYLTKLSSELNCVT